LKNKTRTISIAAAGVTAAFLLTACGPAESGWQAQVRNDAKAYNASQTEAEIQEGCDALSMFGIESPEALTEMVTSMGGTTDPSMWEESGVDPADIPEGKTNEAVLIVSEEMFATCEGVEPNTVEDLVSGAIEDEQDALHETAEPQAPQDRTEDFPLDATAQVGQYALVGDWSFIVTSVERVSDSTVMSWNEYNEPATGQYVLVTWEASYTGTDRTADAYGALSTTFFGADGTVYTEAGVLNEYDAAGASTTVQPGGTVQYANVFDLPVSAIAGGTVSVEDWNTGDYIEYTL